MEKVRGSFQMNKKTKDMIQAQALSENRTFNNMLEELAKRQIEAEKENKKRA